MAPACRLISRPFLNRATVGMLRILYCAAVRWACSVFNLANRTRGSSCAVAVLKCGAIILQGPHQGAQKSTTSGKSLRFRCLSNVWSLSSIGWPVNSRSLQRPHVGLAESLSSGIRFTDSQCGQTTCLSWLTRVTPRQFSLLRDKGGVEIFQGLAVRLLIQTF